VGPTGLAYDEQADVLYVASTSDNEIFKILHAEAANISVLKSILVYNDPTHLHGPLALALASNGDDGVRGRFFGLAGAARAMD
jgi:hypothetical protein